MNGSTCPFHVLDLVRSGAEVTGVVAYDQAFARKPDPGDPPVPLLHLFSQQEAYRRFVERQLHRYDRADRLLRWSSPEKELSQGFGGDVFVKRFPVAEVKWDSPTWEEKTRAYDDGTACGVNASL